MGTKKTSSTVIIPEYSEEMPPECSAGFGMLARMIQNRRRAIQAGINDNTDLNRWFDCMLDEFFEIEVPEYLKNSVVVVHMHDAGYWVKKMMEGEV